MDRTQAGLLLTHSLSPDHSTAQTDTFLGPDKATMRLPQAAHGPIRNQEPTETNRQLKAPSAHWHAHSHHPHHTVCTTCCCCCCCVCMCVCVCGERISGHAWRSCEPNQTLVKLPTPADTRTKRKRALHCKGRLAMQQQNKQAVAAATQPRCCIRLSHNIAAAAAAAAAAHRHLCCSPNQTLLLLSS